MLAYVLSGMLATLPRVEALSYMQADHRRVGFEAHIYLTFLSDSPFRKHRYADVFVDSHRIINNNASSCVHTFSSLTKSSPCAWRSWVC